MSVLAGLSTQRNYELSNQEGDWGEAHDPTIGDSLSLEGAALAVPRIAARSVANLGLAADAIPAAIGTYYGVDNPWWHTHVTESLRQTAKDLTPDPQTTHVAVQIADQVAGMFSDVLVTGGNPVAYSALQAGKKVTESLDDGKGLSTSFKLGAVEGLTAKAFMTVPLGFASKALPIAERVQGAITGAGIGSGIGSANEIAVQHVLETDGYHEEANQHDWTNPETLALNAAFGAVFGAIHPHVLPSHQDAVLTLNEAHGIQHPDGLSATTPAANNLLVDGMNKAVHDLANGNEITSSLPLSRHPEIDPELISLAGERMSRGERQPLEQQKADLEYKLKQIEEGDYSQQGLDIANEQQIKIDAENSGKRISARKLAAQRKSNLETANVLGEGVRSEDAQPHLDSLDRLNKQLAKDDEARAAHSEISRLDQRHLLDNGFIRDPAAELLQKQIYHEVSQLSDAYDQINSKHAGQGDDPLVLIKPEDMEAVAVARGGWKGIGDIEVKGSGWGLAKFIWRHGEKSDKPKDNQITKEDILEFPNIIRNFEPSRKSSDDGSRGREWRVSLRGRTVVFAENKLKDKQHRHMVSVYVQNKEHIDADLPLSKSIAQDSKAEVWSPASDTAHDVSIPSSGLEQPIKTIDQIHTNVNKNESPEITEARDSLHNIDDSRQFEIEHEDGTISSGSAGELMVRADEDMAFAEQSEAATTSAISCFLKFGGL